MIQISNSEQLRSYLREQSSMGKRIAFVPTMGALHDGHLSLMRLAASHAELVVVSIFVNPLQFNNSTDLANYPRTLERDLELAKSVGVHVVFNPSTEEMYPLRDSQIGMEQISTRVQAGGKSRYLCGASRPGHFDGVVTIVCQLFHIISPDFAVFGEKDFQQLRVIEQMVEDLKMGVRIIPGSIVREADGLALSSRNQLLGPKERQEAKAFPESLELATKLFARGERSVSAILEQTAKLLKSQSQLQIDYLDIVDDITVTPIQGTIHQRARVVGAVYAGKVRLIDNRLLSEKE